MTRDEEIQEREWLLDAYRKELCTLKLDLNTLLAQLEGVFEDDWEHTRAEIVDKYAIASGGTFFHPGVADEGNNWANRVGLLQTYRRLMKEGEESEKTEGVEAGSA